MKNGRTSKKIKKINGNKMPDFWAFLIFSDFLRIIFEKKLDFFELQTHNMRAFKLRLKKILIPTPEI